MRRRFFGQKHSKNASSTNNKRLLSPSAIPLASVDHLSNRRSFVDGGTAATKAQEPDFCAVMAEDKYATIGRFAKKWPWECYRPSLPASAMPLPVAEKCRPCRNRECTGDEALNGDGLRRRLRSMARTNGVHGESEDGIALAGSGAHRNMNEESSSHSPHEHIVQPPITPGSTSIAGNSNNRNSTGSTNSSQASSGFESAKSTSSHHLATSTSSGSCSSGVGSSSTTVVLPIASVHANASPDGPASASSRLSSAGSSTQCRSSAYFSISDGLDSSIGPGGTLTIQKKTTKGYCPRVNIAEMMARGIPETEIFAEWLQRLCLSEYLALFLGQGYDLPTLARASPEDLTTLGITRPEDRKRLFQDIQTWRNLQDNWPTYLPNDAIVSDWLSAIGLKQYIELFEQQGYLTVGSVAQLEPEDLEDIGITKLGHIKRVCLALKKFRSCCADAVDDSPFGICPLRCPPSSSASPSSVCALPSVVGLRSADVHSTAFAENHPLVSPIIKRHHSNTQHQQTDQSKARTGNCDKNSQRISFINGIGTDSTEMMCKWREVNSDKSVQLRHLSFETDRGPPRLNLYRTSQIIAQLPREPPPEFDEADDDLTGPNCRRGTAQHAPPPPPAPFAPIELLPLAVPPSSSCPSSYLRLFSSQPTTPRHGTPQLFSHVQMDESQPQQQHHHLRQGCQPMITEESFTSPTMRTEQRRIAEMELTNLVFKR